MLEAEKSVWFEKVFAVYNRNLFKRRFDSLRVSGLDFLLSKKQNFPFLIYANHSSWWDGLIAFEISRAASLDSYFMMEEKQLQKLRLFRKLGAFSVVRDKPRQALKSIDYAAGILREKTNGAVWIFPQGEILPNDIRPLVFYNGLSKIIEKTENCYALPTAIRFEFLGEFKPQIFVKIGEPEMFEAGKAHQLKSFKSRLENELTVLLDKLKEEILQSNCQHFQKLI